MLDGMAKLAIDFGDAALVERYPGHGWARNSQGIKLLWLPVVRAISGIAYPDAKSHPLFRDLTLGQVLEIRAFDVTLSKLALTLRELSSALEHGAEPPMHASSIAEFNERLEALLIVPLFVDLAFVYLRRLADDFARASRFVLFRHIGNAPRKFKELRKWVHDDRLEDLLVNSESIKDAFANHSGWFDSLNERPETGEAKRGIRSSLEHHAVSVSVQHSKTGDDPWGLDVSLGQPMQKEYVSGLVEMLKQIVAEMCEFWTSICEATQIDTEYKMWVCPYGDRLAGVVGNDDQITVFWPQL